MAQQKRQSELYAGEDWKVIYESFSKINLQAYDYETIRTSMVEYLVKTYPDSFNDWVENDEFIFILDTLAFIGQNLAFRMDLNTRENFLDTAERRDSIIRIAKMLSYSPKRSYSASGLAKIESIRTTENVINSKGQNLKDVTIKWNDPTDRDWQENFFSVMNSIFISANQFGEPFKKSVRSNIQTQIYKMNTLMYDQVVRKFNANISGQTMPFDVVNPDIDKDGFVIERTPDLQSQQHVIYLNDGNGFGSNNTGFFVLFKQGSLSYSDHLIEKRIENNIINVSSTNINETDVWVQEVSKDGLLRSNWTKVPSTESIAYNSVTRTLKKIFSVSTQERDRIIIKFPSERNGDVPLGNFRVWYRVNNGLTYEIKTTDIQRVNISYKYTTKTQAAQQFETVTFEFSLKYPVRNAQSSETLEQIKERAPQMYYTQGRFVTGEDYNIAPLSMGNAIYKSKAINRIYSGQSRFYDLIDPVGKYQNTDVFSDDGSVYREVDKQLYSKIVKLPSNKSSQAIVIDDIQPIISSIGTIQYFQEDASNRVDVISVESWNVVNDSSYINGTFGLLSDFNYQIGTVLEFQDESVEQSVWSSIINKVGEYFILSKPVPNGWKLKTYIKPYKLKFSSTNIKNIAAYLDKKTSFSIYYDPDTMDWIPFDGIDINKSVFDDKLVLIRCEYNGDSWNFFGIGLQYVFTGGSKVRFFFVDTKHISDISSGTVQKDKLIILSSNKNTVNNFGYLDDIDFVIFEPIIQDNGYIDGSRSVITSKEVDINGIPLNPLIFRSIIPLFNNETDRIKYEQQLVYKTTSNFMIYNVPDMKFLDTSWKYTTADLNMETNAYFKECLSNNIDKRMTTLNNLYNKTISFTFGFVYDDKYYFLEQIISNNNNRLDNLIRNTMLPSDENFITPETAFYRLITSDGTNETDTLEYYGYKNVSTEYFIKSNARSDIKFHWKHYAPDDNRIDPAKSNIIDMYVLSNEYYENIKIWLKNMDDSNFPLPPTSTELKNLMKEVEKSNVVSDTLIWHSAKFVPLFGKEADDVYKGIFKVVKLTNSKLSDDEIKQRVVELINLFFDIRYWDFGESFFLTELITFIHQNLSTDISSIVLVSRSSNSKFGDLFEIPCQSDELFISTASVDDISIVNSLSKSNINIGN